MEWIEIEKKLPAEGERVLASSYDEELKGSFILIARRVGKDVWYEDTYPLSIIKNGRVTHWAPLLPPPNLSGEHQQTNSSPKFMYET